MKTLLFHAIPPGRDDPRQLDWHNFLHDAALLEMPTGAEQLAPNVWLLPDEINSCVVLSRLCHQRAIATRVLAIVHASDWHPLSPPP